MLRNLMVVGIAIFFITFGVSRLSHTQSVVTSNYLVINSIESQNIEEILSSVNFFIPSISMDINYMGTKPAPNAEGKMEVFVGDAIIGDTLNSNLEGRVTNNFLFAYTVNYNNRSKEIDVLNRIAKEGRPETVEVNHGEEMFNLIQLR